MNENKDHQMTDVILTLISSLPLSEQNKVIHEVRQRVMQQRRQTADILIRHIEHINNAISEL